jgi:hypothetical protein
VGYSVGGDPSGDILDRCNALVAAQYSQILASFLAAETPCGSVGACLRVNLSVPLVNRSLMVQFALPSAGGPSRCEQRDHETAFVTPGF